jgi:hypothetical protein
LAAGRHDEPNAAAALADYRQAGRKAKRIRPAHLDINVSAHHDDPVRTTLTLDRDVAEALAREMRRTGRGLKAAVNDALRRGLRLTGPAPRPPRFRVEPHAFGVKAGVDLDRMNQLVDELDAESSARKLAR